MNYTNIVISILIGIIVYVVLGSFFILIGTTIYDDFPTENLTYSDFTSRSIILRNNAPFTFPYVNPSFFLAANIEKETGNVSCHLESGKGSVPCERSSIDLGYVSPGQMDRNSIKISITPNNNNFTLKSTAFINYILISIPKYKYMDCIKQDEKFYRCG